MWKSNIPVMIVLYCLKPNKKLLLVSTTHVEPDICDAPHKKAMLMDFYNHYFQATYDSQVVLVFVFILDLAAVNAITILKYNKENYINSKRDFLKNVATYFKISYIKNRVQIINLQLATISAINDVLEFCGATRRSRKTGSTY